jgi:hypothetical protein
MVLQALKLSFHLSSPQEFIDSSLKDHFSYFGERENSCAGTAENDENGEDHTLRGEFSDFLKADSENSDDSHIKTVEEWPSFNKMAADCADEDHNQEESYRFPHFFNSTTIAEDREREKDSMFLGNQSRRLPPSRNPGAPGYGGLRGDSNALRKSSKRRC